MLERPANAPEPPRRTSIYAIVRTGGKQYRVEPDQILDVDRLDAEVGSTIELTDVLLLSQGENAVVGSPRVADARVMAEVVEHGRDGKIVVFKYKNKTRYRRKKGHRQDYTRLSIMQMGIGKLETAEKKSRPSARKKVKADEAAGAAETESATEAVATTTVETPRRAPRRSRKPTSEPAASEASDVTPQPEAGSQDAEIPSDAPQDAPSEEQE
jgi:large subunit ribosomal protein L21